MVFRITAALFMVLTGATLAFGQGRGSPIAIITLSLPNRGWALEIQAAGFATQRDETREDGNARYFSATNGDAGLNVSVLLETTSSSQSGAHCRAYYWDNLKKRSPLKMDDVKMSESGQMALLEYMVKQFRDCIRGDGLMGAAAPARPAPAPPPTGRAWAEHGLYVD